MKYVYVGIALENVTDMLRISLPCKVSSNMSKSRKSNISNTRSFNMINKQSS